MLKKAHKLLKEIKELQETIQRYREKKSPMHGYTEISFAAHSPTGGMFSADNIIYCSQIIAKNWVEMRNYPRAIQAYKFLIEEFPHKRFSVADALIRTADLYMQDKQYARAIHTYDTLFESVSESFRGRGDTIYQQAVCFHAMQRYTKAYKGFQTYIRFEKNDKNASYLKEAKQIVQQFEQDQDKDGYHFYKEQENGTSDQDPNSHP